MIRITINRRVDAKPSNGELTEYLQQRAEMQKKCQTVYRLDHKKYFRQNSNDIRGC